MFLQLQSYLLSNPVQEEIMKVGYRANYGGTIDSKYEGTFKPAYGIQGDRCLSPVKYPSMPVIKEALSLYQVMLRKPAAIVFCLDYSGSMSGKGVQQLTSAMGYILDNKRTAVDFLQFSKGDIVAVLSFSDKIKGCSIKTGSDNDLAFLLRDVKGTNVGGGTDIYLAALKAFELLEQYPDDYNKSVVLMTDGESNCMTFYEFQEKAKSHTVVPVYSITFGSAKPKQLKQLAEETGGKVFDGVKDLTNAFREVRGYN